MGKYINPGNQGFTRVLRRRYVDKTGLIALFDEVLESAESLVCVTRPRRFGKSYAAYSLVAYYDCSCDSHALFEGLEVANMPGYGEHLNAYNVAYLDASCFVLSHGADVVDAIISELIRDLRAEFGGIAEGTSIDDAFFQAVQSSGRQFVFVLDEWDAPMREDAPDALKKRYVDFLRLLFKNGNFTDRVVAGAYMTGILPIKHYGTQSALNNFREFTMVSPFRYAPYVGFSEGEVEGLVAEYGLDFGEVRSWYDGYELPGAGHVYAPYSTMQACQNGHVGSYWSGSEAFESLRFYIDLDFDGLQGDIVRAVGGDEIKVDPYTFDNDMHDVRSRDAALTLLVHLGYLAYDDTTKRARVPNEEVRVELARALRESRHTEVARVVRESDELLQALLSGDEDAVAKGVQRVHDLTCAPIHYNDEQALRAVVKSALLAATDEYTIIDELPSGRGYADVVYLPKRGSSAPALVVELKWDENTEAAIAQIRGRDYPAVLRDYGGPILLVGITYDAKTKTHRCQIEHAAG